MQQLSHPGAARSAHTRQSCLFSAPALDTSSFATDDVQGTSVTFHWTRGGAACVCSYLVSWNGGADSKTVSASAATVTGLLESTQYAFVVTPNNLQGGGGSHTHTVTTSGAAAPPAPATPSRAADAVGSASALVTFVCVLCTLRTPSSRPIRNFTPTGRRCVVDRRHSRSMGRERRHGVPVRDAVRIVVQGGQRDELHHADTADGH
jgi:hypothetical protein